MVSILKGSRPYLPVTQMPGALHKLVVKPPLAGNLPYQASESPLMSHDQDRYPAMLAMYSFDSQQLKYTPALSLEHLSRPRYRKRHRFASSLISDKEAVEDSTCLSARDPKQAFQSLGFPTRRSYPKCLKALAVTWICTGCHGQCIAITMVDPGMQASRGL